MDAIANLVGEATKASGHTVQYLGIGSTATPAPSATDTQLTAEIARIAYSAQTETSQILTTTKTGWVPGACTINECGLFWANSGNNTMHCRLLTGAITLLAGDTLNITITLQVKQGA
jgi:hypothetical protein